MPLQHLHASAKQRQTCTCPHLEKYAQILPCGRLDLNTDCQGALKYWQLFSLPSQLYWRRQWHPTPLLLPGKYHGWRSLVGCSPWGRKESDMTERLHFDFSLSCIREGNGTPLHCSCLENPRDGGAWWAAVCGVTQSRTQLKWLSGSSSSKQLYNKT